MPQTSLDWHSAAALLWVHARAVPLPSPEASPEAQPSRPRASESQARRLIRGELRRAGLPEA